MQDTRERERGKGRGKRKGKTERDKKEEKEREEGGKGKSDSERKTNRRQEKAREGSFVFVHRSRNAPDLGGGKYLSPSTWSIFTFEWLGNTGDQNCLSQETKRCSEVEAS